MDKAEASTTAQLLQQKGLEQEAVYLQRLKDEGKSVVEIPKDRNLQDHAQLTLEAMQSGADVIYQAVFFASPWWGDADFLIKCDTPSDLGDFSYEVDCVSTYLLRDWLLMLKPEDAPWFKGLPEYAMEENPPQINARLSPSAGVS